MNILDLLILILLVLGAVQGFRRGLISTAGGLVGFLGGLTLAGRYYVPFSNILGEKLGLRALFARILLPLLAGLPTAGKGNLWPWISAVTTSSSGQPQTGFPPSLWEPLLGLKAGLSGASRDLLLADALVKVIAFALIFGAVGLAVGYCAALISKLLPLLFLGGINRLGGLVLGLLVSILDLVVVIGLLTPVVISFAVSIPVYGGDLLAAWHNAVLVPYFVNCWVAVTPILQQFFHMV
jgi:uncharacterized membrane protein required for colicin V production